nr:PREDICTED: histone deacetylase complex subunit SAP30 [Equus przewalskii]
MRVDGTGRERALRACAGRGLGERRRRSGPTTEESPCDSERGPSCRRRPALAPDPKPCPLTRRLQTPAGRGQLRCGRAAGNASFSKRIQKSISQKKVKIELDKSARHLYICDYHKNLIQSVRNRRKRKGSDDDGGDSPVQDIDTPEVDLYQLQVNTLRRYKRHFKLPTRPGLNKAQLVEVNKVQRMSGRTCPQEQQRLRRPKSSYTSSGDLESLCPYQDQTSKDIQEKSSQYWDSEEVRE